MVTPLPPPVGGIGSWAETLLRSALPRHFDLRVLDTSPPQKGSVRSGNRPRFGRGLTSSDCIQITHMGTALLGVYLLGTHVWLQAGLPAGYGLVGSFFLAHFDDVTIEKILLQELKLSF